MLKKTLKKLKPIEKVTIVNYHGYIYNVPSANEKLYFGVEFEFEEADAKGIAIIASVFDKLAHAEADGTVAVEFPTEVLEFTDDNIKDLAKRMGLIKEIAEEANVTVVPGSCHVHVSLTKQQRVELRTDSGRAKIKDRIINVQKYIGDELFGRKFNQYAEKMDDHNYKERHCWVNIMNPTKGIEYRLPYYKNPGQFIAMLLFIRDYLHPYIVTGNLAKELALKNAYKEYIQKTNIFKEEIEETIIEELIVIEEKAVIDIIKDLNTQIEVIDTKFEYDSSTKYLHEMKEIEASKLATEDISYGYKVLFTDAISFNETNIVWDIFRVSEFRNSTHTTNTIYTLVQNLPPHKIVDIIVNLLMVADRYAYGKYPFAPKNRIFIETVAFVIRIIRRALRYYYENEEEVIDYIEDMDDTKYSDIAYDYMTDGGQLYDFFKELLRRIYE